MVERKGRKRRGEEEEGVEGGGEKRKREQVSVREKAHLLPRDVGCR